MVRSIHVFNMSHTSGSNALWGNAFKTRVRSLTSRLVFLNDSWSPPFHYCDPPLKDGAAFVLHDLKRRLGIGPHVVFIAHVYTCIQKS